MSKPLARATHAYIAIEKCGCVTGICSDYGDKATGNDVAGFIKSGRAVERFILPEAIERFGFICEQHKKKQIPLIKEQES